VLDAKHFLDRVFIEGRTLCSLSRAEAGKELLTHRLKQGDPLMPAAARAAHLHALEQLGVFRPLYFQHAERALLQARETMVHE
jgi:hypothetical protein